MDGEDYEREINGCKNTSDCDGHNVFDIGGGCDGGCKPAF